ncbi:MAG TPA: PilW family protein [Burkholderiales bacterium]|nr:PilW family protein [Burkholderiales bacterium]
MNAGEIGVRQRGFNLVELMVALSLGLFVALGISMMFVGASRSERELMKTAQQIENGRYAVDILSKDLWHAGFYGYLLDRPAPPAVEPDPCVVNDTAAMYSALANPVQVFWAPDWASVADVSVTTCAIPSPMPGSDVLVIRRANTQEMLPTDATTAGDVYIQTVSGGGEIQIGNGALLGTGNRANGTPASSPPPLLKTDGSAALIYKYHVRVYFVSRCSNATGAGAVCQPSDDGGKWIPTLKRLELSSNGGATAMRLVSIAEGIDALRVDLGVDNTPANLNPLTTSVGDGMPDAFLRMSVNRITDFSNAVAANVWVLARNNQATPNYTDAKVYDFGPLSGTKAAANDAFARHLFSGQVQIANAALRRQIP